MKLHLAISHFDSAATEAIKPHNTAKCATISCSEKATKVLTENQLALDHLDKFTHLSGGTTAGNEQLVLKYRFQLTDNVANG